MMSIESYEPRFEHALLSTSARDALNSSHDMVAAIKEARCALSRLLQSDAKEDAAYDRNEMG
jgi:hypothetical protein